jgi:alkanesulfonate monooxygenase SsuD/methylene tetrahydromethanopterin reductase-like flavin-dependent oxidoreductase (luciferase family)
VKLGLTLPSFVDDPVIPLGVARVAEDAGVDGVFVYDHVWRDIPPPRRPALECFALLGALAAETSSIHIGSLVARATLRPPATLATAFDAVHRISDGRLIAAIGAGDRESRAENEACGLDFGTNVDRIAALLAATHACVGRGYPVWVAGHAHHLLEICSHADGWNGWADPPDVFADYARAVREVSPRITVTWAGLVALAADDDAAAAKVSARKVSPGTIVGGPAALARRLTEYEQIGTEWAIVAPVDASNADNARFLGAVRQLLDRA